MTTRSRTRSKPSSTKASAPATHDPATQYAHDVVDGKIITGKLVRLACERHLRDLDTGHERGLSWHPELAALIYAFAALLCHWKGRWAGKPIRLEPWECFFLGMIWGWRRSDGTRRFRHVHLEVARKNGKTLLAAVLALALLVLDDESAPDVYVAATKLDQARITHEDCKRLASRSQSLSGRLEVFKTAIASPWNSGTCQPLGRDSGTLDGLNIHGAILDELHAWKDRHLLDVISTATGARDQPLIVRTTTAGYDKQSLWWELRGKCVDVLMRKRDDDRLFVLIYTLDEDDDWKDEKNFIKANPNLGVTVKIEDLRIERDDAVATQGQQPAFRRLKLNQLTEAVSTWIDIARWDACAHASVRELITGRRCITGIDFSAVRDLTAIVHVFPPPISTDPDGIWIMIPHFWLPEEGIDEKADQDGQPYRRWAEDGWLTLIPGPVIRDEYIESRIEEDNARHMIDMLVFDRRFTMALAPRLASKGFQAVGFGQGFLSMKDPTVEFERKVIGQRICHNGSPVLKSCVANVAIEQDPAGNRKPTKKKSTGRIDGVIAALMALGYAMDQPNMGDGGVEVW